MEGPTPVSALIHAATMVTAGVYMVARSHALFERSGTALEVVAWVGTATALFAATIGLVQPDIKRVLAYSTVSQLRSEEHTSELQSPCNLVCRLLLEKKKKIEA